MNYKASYYQVKQVRDAIARELARHIQVDDELVAAKEAADEAQAKFRNMVRQKAAEVSKSY